MIKLAQKAPVAGANVFNSEVAFDHIWKFALLQLLGRWWWWWLWPQIKVLGV